jgi:hypothetical protein
MNKLTPNTMSFRISYSVGEPFVPKGFLTGMVIINTEVLLLHWTILDILIDFLAPKDFWIILAYQSFDYI